MRLMRNRSEESPIANFVLLAAVLLAVASFLALNAREFASAGLNWVTGVCSAAPLVCDHPHQATYVAAGLGGLWVLMKFVSALRD